MLHPKTGIIYNLSNPNDMWSEWKKLFLGTIEKHALLRKARGSMTKTEFMLLWSRQRLCALTVPPRPSINGASIEKVTSGKSQRVLSYQ